MGTDPVTKKGFLEEALYLIGSGGSIADLSASTSAAAARMILGFKRARAVITAPFGL